MIGLTEDTPAPTVRGVRWDCFRGAELALYDHIVRVILLGDDWRYVGGLTRLIHEMQHYADDLAAHSQSECAATRVAAAWADDHGYFNEARRERSYGAGSCNEIGEFPLALTIP